MYHKQRLTKADQKLKSLNIKENQKEVVWLSWREFHELDDWDWKKIDHRILDMEDPGCLKTMAEIGGQEALGIIADSIGIPHTDKRYVQIQNPTTGLWYKIDRESNKGIDSNGHQPIVFYCIEKSETPFNGLPIIEFKDQ